MKDLCIQRAYGDREQPVTGVWQGRHYPVGRENAKNWGYYSQYTYENQHFVYQKGISDRGPL